MNRDDGRQRVGCAALSMGIAIGGFAPLAGAVDVVIGPWVAGGEHLTMVTAAVEAHTYPPGVEVNIVVTPAVPWPGPGVFYRPVTIRSRVPGIQAFLTGAMTFNGGSEGSEIDEIDFQMLTGVSSPRVTTYVDIDVLDTEFSGLSGSSSGDLGGAMHINGNVTIESCEFHDFHCEGAGGAIQIVGGAVGVSDSVFTSCTADDDGGGISAIGDTSLVLTDCTFLFCESSDGDGGGVHFGGTAISATGDNVFITCTANNGGALWANASGDVILKQCKASSCTSDQDGGGFWVRTGAGGEVTAAEFDGNSASGDGGSLYAAGALTVSGLGSIANSIAGGRGGAVCLADGATLHGCNFYTNQAGISGGAVHLAGSNCTLSGGGTMLLQDNESDGSGGAISTSGDSHLITGVQCRYNTADAGGAISIGAGKVTILASVFDENEGGVGGGVYASGSGELVMDNVTANRNIASIGGGVWAAYKNLNVTETMIERNTVAFGAGGVYLNSCTGSIGNTTIRLHDVAGNAGGIMLMDCNMSLNACNVRLNTAVLSGGGLYADGGSIALSEGGYEQNYAMEDGGGIWAHVDDLTINKALVGNNAAFLGGGLYQRGGESHFVDATVAGNTGEFGGGVFSFNGDVSIERTLVQNNEAQEDGGGVLVSYFGDLVCNDSTFSDNIAGLRGGGVFLSESTGSFVDTDVLGCTGVWAGGGLCAVQSTFGMHRCVVSGNWSGYGGGLYVVGSGWAKLLETSVSWNISDADAGGISIGSNTLLIADGLQLRGNRLTDESTGTGTAIFGGQKMFIANSLIADNGAASVIQTMGELRLYSSTVTHNGGGINCTGPTPSWIANSIVWANTGIGVVGADIVYSCIEGGASGAGNIDVDPMFVDPLGMNYRLLADSPCFNAGKVGELMQDELDADGDGDVLELTPLDLQGNPRVMGGHVDMGAYEIVVEDPPCDGDLNGDGTVDINDLLAVIAGWGSPDGDINGDGTTDITDLLVLLEFFGPC